MSPEGGRRLAAVVFTDMVGYTALAQRNEALSLELVERQRAIIRPIISRHNGREVKTIGDAFLLEFQSALEAVRCAFDIQRSIREHNMGVLDENGIHLRVGVHLGDVVESGGDISGDAVNVASRIEPLADDGGVCLTRQVYDNIRNKFEIPMKSIGTKPLKNVLVPIEVFRMVMPWEEQQAPEAHLDKVRVAVLPFTNMSPDPNDEYFADGMTEELITSLSGVSGLTVISRTSVTKYKGGSKGASEIGHELSAGTIVEGSVRKAGSRVRITVQMIDSLNEGHLWAQNYDKQMDDIFAIQSDVAKQVADALQVRLLTSEKKKLDALPTSSIKAYTFYLKGKYFTEEGFGSNESFRTGMRYLEDAIALDPNFALAHTSLAWCHNQLGFFGMASSREEGIKAKECVGRALALDPSLAEAHHVHGRIIRNYDWDFEGAEAEFRRAIELNPSMSVAYGAMAVNLCFARKFAEAVAMAGRVLELDHMSSDGASYAWTAILYSGHYEEAAAQFERALAFEPNSAFSRGNLGLAYIKLGRLEEGMKQMRFASGERSFSHLSDLAYALSKTGRTDELKALLEDLKSTAANDHDAAVALASAYANSGDPDHAVEWLQLAYDERVAYFNSVNSDFVFDAVRPDPRFQSLMKKVGWTNTL